VRRGALAGIAAAAAWAAAEPVAARALGTTFSDVRLLGRLVTRGRGWAPAGLALHLANGALFGVAFEALGGRGPGRGVVAAVVENALLWPGMAVVERVHPDVRAGRWPPLATNAPVFAQEVAMHALFGAVLGVLSRRRPAGLDSGL
jgi:hypothetical protein